MKDLLTPMEESKLILYLLFFFYFLCGLVLLLNKNMVPTFNASFSFVILSILGFITTYKLQEVNNNGKNIRKQKTTSKRR